MWPWEHVAFAYVLYSLCSRAVWRRSPNTRAAIVLAVASVLPDLVDKPLAWWLSVLPAGRSLGHSALVAVPLVAAVLAVGWLLDERPVAVAFAAGYLSHLSGDVIYPLVVKGELRVGFLLWPVVPAAGDGTDRALPHLWGLVDAFVAFLATPRGALYLVGEGALVAAALWLWAADEYPGLDLFRRDPPEPIRE